MNKLISKNLVQRFKQGRKLIKAQFGWQVRKDGVVVNRFGVPVRANEAGYRPYSMTQDASYQKGWPDDKQIAPGLYLESGTNNVYASRPEDDDGSAVGNLISTGPEPPANGTYYETTDASGKIVDRGRYFGGKQHSLPIGGTQRKRAYYQKGADGSLYLIGTDGSKTLIKKGSSNTQVQKPKNSQNKISFKDAFNKARQSGLQEFVWNGGRYNTQKEGEENFIFQNGKWVAPQPAVETPVVPQIQLPTVPTSIYSLMNPVEKDLKAPLSAPVIPQTYNRAQVREFLRNKGVNPYSFSGDQRRALRMVLNGQGTDEDKALIQSMGIFKKGGQLPSRNPITRFKNRKSN